MLKKPKAARRQVAAKSNANEFEAEYRYASHHHLIPLYVLSGAAILAILVIACFIGVLWQTSERESFRQAANNSVQTIENLYIPAVIQPTEKKQYIYSANVRFPAADPYENFRYSYDPGLAGTATSATITLTTSRTLQSLEAPLLQNPDQLNDASTRLQQCAALYVIRFVPGATPFGNFMPLQEVKLRDGRTAYIHKNTACVPDSVQAMNQLDDIEKNIAAIESF